MTWIRRALLLVVLVTFAGCAVPAASPPPRGSQSPRTRCLSDPREGATRPIFFLFCVESP